jgi:hypothetical protein
MVADPLTLTAYAQRRGVSVKAVSKAVAAGRLAASVVRNHHGAPKIADADLADREWEANTRTRGATPQLVAARASSSAPSPTTQPSPEQPAGPDFNLARAARAAAGARREAALADMAELDLASLRGQLVDAEEARSSVIAAFSLVKTRLLGVPSRVGQRLPELADRVVPVVEELLMEALKELSDR